MVFHGSSLFFPASSLLSWILKNHVSWRPLPSHRNYSFANSFSSSFMVRTKQLAPLSTVGQAPRAEIATKPARNLRGAKRTPSTSREKLSRRSKGRSDVTKVLLIWDDAQMPNATYTSLRRLTVYRVDADEFEEFFSAHIIA